MCHAEGWINPWGNRANDRMLALLGASRLNVKALLYWFFMFSGCSPRVKIAELYDYCVYYCIYCKLRELTTLAFIVLSYLKELNQTGPRFVTQ